MQFASRHNTVPNLGKTQTLAENNLHSVRFHLRCASTSISTGSESAYMWGGTQNAMSHANSSTQINGASSRLQYNLHKEIGIYFKMDMFRKIAVYLKYLCKILFFDWEEKYLWMGIDTPFHWLGRMIADTYNCGHFKVAPILMGQ